MNLAFYGTLRDHDVLHQVVGDSLASNFYQSIAVKGWACLRIEGQAYPLLRSDADAFTTFDLYHDCGQDSWGRLVEYEGDEYFPAEIEIDGRSYQVFMAEEGIIDCQEPWRLEIFQRDYKLQYLRDLS